MRSRNLQQSLGAEPILDVGWHAVAGVFAASNGIPKVMRDEFQEQAFRRRPGEGSAGGE